MVIFSKLVLDLTIPKLFLIPFNNKNYPSLNIKIMTQSYFKSFRIYFGTTPLQYKIFNRYFDTLIIMLMILKNKLNLCI